MADRGVGRSASAAAAGAGCADDPTPFVTWASAQRRRAALDGAWRVEVSERFVHGVRIRSVTSWHAGRQQHTSSRRAPPPSDMHAGFDARPAAGEHPQRQSARQRRSALRSAAHHKQVRLRALRSHLLAVRFLVRLSRLCKAAHALRLARDAPPTLKRRHPPSPPPSDQPGRDDDAALAPPPKRLEVPELLRTVLRRVGLRAS